MHNQPNGSIHKQDTAERIPIAAHQETYEQLNTVVRTSTRVDWNAVTAITSAIALIFVGVALFYNNAELRMTREIAQSQYLMSYYSEFQQFNDVQMKFIAGAWSQPGVGPESQEEWYRVARYMGLLEQIEVLIDSGIMTAEVADRSYSHRVRAVYRNELVRRRYLEGEKFRWQLFLRLVNRLERMPVYSGLRERDGRA